MNQKIRKHHFIAMSKMITLQNMGKEKEKLKKKNTSERNKMATHHMGIVK